MSGRSVPVLMQVGDVELLVEAVVPPGSEPTSGRLDQAGARVVDAFERAQAAIVEIGGKLAGSVQQLRERGAHPSSVEVAFGLKFTAKGSLVVTEASGEASLTVKITYDRDSTVSAAQAAPAVSPGQP
jgi:hypothetical protein